MTIFFGFFQMINIYGLAIKVSYLNFKDQSEKLSIIEVEKWN